MSGPTWFLPLPDRLLAENTRVAPFKRAGSLSLFAQIGFCANEARKIRSQDSFVDNAAKRVRRDLHFLSGRLDYGS